MLGMKPILTFQDNEVRPFAKAIGKRNVMEKLLVTLEDYSKHDGFEGTFGVVWSDNHDVFEELVEKMRDRLPVNSLISGQISPVVGAHSGPGALGVMCY